MKPLERLTHLVLDNVTLYWLTNTAVSSARLYWESKLAFFAPKHVTIPTAISVFPDEIYAAPRSWAERAYSKLIHFNALPRGGHFAAWGAAGTLCRRTPGCLPNTPGGTVIIEAAARS